MVSPPYFPSTNRNVLPPIVCIDAVFFMPSSLYLAPLLSCTGVFVPMLLISCLFADVIIILYSCRVDFCLSKQCVNIAFRPPPSPLLSVPLSLYLPTHVLHTYFSPCTVYIRIFFLHVVVVPHVLYQHRFLPCMTLRSPSPVSTPLLLFLLHLCQD